MRGKIFKWTFVAKFIQLSFVIAMLTVVIGGALRVLAAAPSVALGATLTRVSDGTAPFASVDPNASNGLVATLDSTNYSFDVNVNTVDAAPHTVNGVSIVATLNSTSADVQWQLSSLPTACGTKTVSSDGKTLTCVLSGSFNTGTALNISASWWGKSSVPNNTNVTTQFSVSANMVPDASLGSNPTTATSATDTVAVVSTPADYEVRKMPGPITVVRDSSGNPTALRVDWALQVETKNPQSGQVKGINTAGLSDLSLKDTLATGDSTQLPIQSHGHLVSCGDIPVNTNVAVAGSRSTLLGNYQAVQDSGSWNCTQAGGTGTDITINATGIKWNPDWYTAGQLGQIAHYWAWNSGGSNDVYNSPAGQNDQAVVATQMVRIDYPYSDVLAFDQQSGDKAPQVNSISWCNDIGNVSVVGGNNGVDQSTDNQACVVAPRGVEDGSTSSKSFVRDGDLPGTGPESDLGLTSGTLSNNQAPQDNYVAPGQRFAINLNATDDPRSVNSLNGVTMCDAIDQSTYNFVTHDAATPPGTATGSGNHAFSSWYITGTADPVFNAITDSDVVVEYSSTNTTWPSQTAQRTTNCDDSGLSWVTNPTTYPGGIAAVNLMRVRLLQPLPPGVGLQVFATVKVKTGLSVGTKLNNYSQYKATNQNSGNWYQAPSSCDLSSPTWGTPSIGRDNCSSFGVRADRAIVVLPPGVIQDSDTSTPTNDVMLSASLGSAWTYTLKAGVGYNANAIIQGVHVYNVLPPGVVYQSATITPTLVVNDCNASVNPTCLTDPSARTNIGYTSLQWDRGDFTFTHTGSADTPSQDYSLFGSWQVTTKIANFVPNSVQLQNKSWLTADSGLSTAPSPLPFRTTGTTSHNDLTSGPLDDDWVQIATTQAFAIEKYTSQAQIPLEGTLGYTLAFGNLTGVTKVMDGIDILPFQGDGRSPQSVIDGNYSLSSVSESLSTGLINQVYITNANPQTLNSDPNDASNPSVGTGKWSCTYSQMGTFGCPSDCSAYSLESYDRWPVWIVAYYAGYTR